MATQTIIDNIKSEIVDEIIAHSGTGEEIIQAYTDGLKMALDIINKHSAESGE